MRSAPTKVALCIKYGGLTNPLDSKKCQKWVLTEGTAQFLLSHAYCSMYIPIYYSGNRVGAGNGVSPRYGGSFKLALILKAVAKALIRQSTFWRKIMLGRLCRTLFGGFCESCDSKKMKINSLMPPRMGGCNLHQCSFNKWGSFHDVAACD